MNENTEEMNEPIGRKSLSEFFFVFPSEWNGNEKYSLSLDHRTMEIEEDFRCSSCRFILIEPRFPMCGHRYCNICLKKMFMSTQPTLCLLNDCREVINKNEIHPDVPIEKRLNRLTTIPCPNKSNGCSWTGNYSMYKEHMKECPFARLQCDLCSASFAHRSPYEEHLSACPKALVPCPLSSIGCQDKIRRENVCDHLTSSLIEHFQRFNDRISTNQTPMNTDEDLRREIQTLEKKLAKTEQELVRMRIDSKLMTGESFEWKKALELTKPLIYHDGTFLWCIENIQQSFYNAKNSDEPVYLLSSPFYTSRTGYKLSLKIYLNGDKTVRNSHLSLYVTIMRNDYDSLLQWPFAYPITFCLYDQSPRHDHVVHTLKPDLESESFQKPRMASNKSSGIPDFCPLWKVFSKDFGYVKENRMFIKAFVDFDLFPTSIWPLWTKLQSAGLPTEVEHRMLDTWTKENGC